MQQRILFVEDEKKIANTIKAGLEENGYCVETAYDGNKGYECFIKEEFDLVVLDVNLPGISGIQLCKIIRSLNPNIPVIMLTALSSLKDKIQGYEAGADDYIVKPFEFKELLMKIKVIFRRNVNHHLPSAIILKAADLEMDLEAKEVRRGKTKINLTAKEFQLLEYLLKNKNKVLSRADIAINVWDIDFDTNTNVIDVYINYLRNKVDRNFPEKLIHTQVGMGYILKENMDAGTH